MDTRLTVIVTKMGSICYTSEYNENRRSQKQKVKGEQGTTEAVVAHLLSLDLNVIYFGQWRGELPDGLHYVSSNIEGLNCWSKSSKQLAGFEKDILELDSILGDLDTQPVAFIAVSGYASNMSVINNEWQITCQAAAIRYNAPSLNVMKNYNLPRITICNDTRNYPNEGEVATEGWEALRSVALLSQREKYWIKSLQYEHWYVDEKYAAAEHWRLFDERVYPEKTVDCQIVAHAHMKDGKKLKGYDEVWQKILGGEGPKGLKIYGLGWEHFSWYRGNEDLFPGIADMKEVFARSKCTVITMTGGELYTNKARFALSQNCLPLFYGHGEDYTMDPLGKYLSIDSRFRITNGTLNENVRYFCDYPGERQYLIDKLWDLTSPNYSMLDDCITGIANGEHLIPGNGWREKYGGYYKNRRSGTEYSKNRI